MEKNLQSPQKISHSEMCKKIVWSNNLPKYCLERQFAKNGCLGWQFAQKQISEQLFARNDPLQHCHKHKGAQDPGLRMSTLVQSHKLWSHWTKYVGSNLNLHWWNYCFALVFGFMPNQIVWALRLPKYEKTELNSTPWCSSCCRKLETNLWRPFCTHFAHPQSRILSPFCKWLA